MQKPQLGINTFGGDCITFKKFMRQFKCRVEGLCSDDERIAYLEQYTLEEAHKIVVGFSYQDAEVGYPATMAELRRRHGDPEVMANSYIKKVMSWPTIRADYSQALDEFAVFLKECEAATRCVGGLGVLEFSENLKRILQKIPYFMHDKWRTVVQRLQKNGTIIGFCDFAEFKQNDPVYGRSNLTSDKKHRQDGKAKIAAGTNVEVMSHLAQRLEVSGRRSLLKTKTMGPPCGMPTRIVTGLMVGAIGGDGVEVNLPPVFAKFNLPVEEWHILTERDIEVWEYMKDIKLPKLSDIHGIDLLIGNNVPAANAPIEVKTGPLGSPYAKKTRLGWVAWRVKRDGAVVISSNFIQADNNLEDLFKQSLNYDFPGRSVDDRREWSWEDRQFMEIMDSSCKKVDGHYQVNLPLRDQDVKLPNNKHISVKGLTNLGTKMERQPKFAADYVAFMEDVVSKGYAERVPEGQPEKGKEWYIPHHGVYHPRKPEKIRVVFKCGLNAGNILK
ncbi:hypothetical protein HOLleu_07931 [Holothuria leucospilota]|uniref:Uncharacterized protein n=1 Tax=Holothuria leucospilota TaxID=206669 RepID=A0A9Q1HFY3_HOLLE|nr:hypothetical protein HOLleu_07931 [Holothuria leucospilota]